MARVGGERTVGLQLRIRDSKHYACRLHRRIRNDASGVGLWDTFLQIEA
jgi:hypothetical protein